jgi:hypothetical protein
VVQEVRGEKGEVGSVPPFVKGAADNKQVAPAPRYARLRGTPAQGISGPGGVPDCIEEGSLVRRRGSAGVATLERYATLPE